MRHDRIQADLAQPLGLTEEIIRGHVASKVGGGRVELVDGIEAGLRLRVGGGRIQWSVVAWDFDGKRVRIPLGAWPRLDPEQARTLARSCKRAFERVGDDEPEVLTLGRLLERYDARRLSQLRKGKVIHRALKTVLAPLQHRDVTALTRRDISELVDRMADRAPIHANRVLAYAKAFLNWGVGRGYLETNPAAGISKPTREAPRERTPTLDELAQIWKGADGLGYPFGPAIKLLILTAARRDEVGGMRVAELQLPEGAGEGCWVLPADRSKNGRALRIPLAPLAVAVIQQALKDRDRESAFLFTTNGERPVSGWSKAKARLDEALIPKGGQSSVAPPAAWRLHDLRRSFATAACDLLNVDPAVADRCLNHVGASTTSTVARIYGRSEMYEPRRDALLRWAELITAEVGAAESSGTNDASEPSEIG